MTWQRLFARPKPHATGQLKERFTSAPVLKLPDPTKPFVVEVDASEVGLGEVLSQYYGAACKLHPCAFFSRKLTDTERNYDIANRELLAVKAVLEECMPLVGRSQTPFYHEYIQ